MDELYRVRVQVFVSDDEGHRPGVQDILVAAPGADVAERVARAWCLSKGHDFKHIARAISADERILVQSRIDVENEDATAEAAEDGREPAERNDEPAAHGARPPARR